jgi:hypothetical protein
MNTESKIEIKKFKEKPLETEREEEKHYYQ